MGKIREAAVVLFKYQDQYMGWYSGYDDQERPIWNCWVGALNWLMWELGRQLTEEEDTLFSLSICYGPTPALVDGERTDLLAMLWPEGNPRGDFLPLDEVLRVLEGGSPRPVMTVESN